MKRSFLLPLFFVAACEGTPPPVVAPQPPPTAVAAHDVAPEVPTTEPKSLILLARWRAPSKSADQVLKTFGSPVSVTAMLEKEDPELIKQIDLDASVDFALSLDPESTDDDPKVLAAFSIALRSFEDARAGAEKDGAVTPVAGGALRLSGKRAEKAGVCDLTKASDAAARLVCGQKARDVDALRPWLSVGLAKDPSPTNDMVVSVRAAALRERYLPILRKNGQDLVEKARDAMSGQRVNDPELLGAPGVVLDESLHFLEDVDSIDLRIAFAPVGPEVIATGGLRFGAKSSWLTRALTEANDKAGPPPQAFWRLPRDTNTGTWGRGSDPRAYDGIRRVLHKALEEALAKVPLPDADKGSLVALLDTAPRVGGSWVSAQGLVKKAKPTPKGAPVDVKAVVTSAIGWTVTGVEGPAGEYVAWGKQAVDVYQRGLRLAHDFLALAAKKGKKEEDPLRLAPKLNIVNAPAGWPKGTVAFDAVVNLELAYLLGAKKKGDKDDAKKPSFKGNVTLRFAVVPDGDRTWLGFSADLDELKKHMAAVMSGARPDGTIASREGLDRLKAGGQTWGGFFSFGELLDRAVESVENEKPAEAAEMRAAFATLPNHGRTPVLLLGQGSAGDKPSDVAEVRLEAGSLADLSAVVTYFVNKKPAAAQQRP